jgi:hypothetical protein
MKPMPTAAVDPVIWKASEISGIKEAPRKVARMIPDVRIAKRRGSADIGTALGKMIPSTFRRSEKFNNGYTSIR